MSSIVREQLMMLAGAISALEKTAADEPPGEAEMPRVFDEFKGCVAAMGRLGAVLGLEEAVGGDRCGGASVVGAPVEWEEFEWNSTIYQPGDEVWSPLSKQWLNVVSDLLGCENFLPVRRRKAAPKA